MPLRRSTPGQTQPHLDFADKDSRIICHRTAIIVVSSTHLDAMHSSTQVRCSEGYFCHVAEVVGARCETRYAFLVSALIRIALSVWPALASKSPSTPSHRLLLLRCSDVSKNRPPQSVRFSPNNCLLPRRLGLSRYAHCAFPRSVLADRVVTAMTM